MEGILKCGRNKCFPSHMKADIVKLLESTPKEYQHYIKRIRGGFLKIQGTWLPYKLCKILARRFCYHIRYSLIPLFGADFPNSCLKPNARGFGELKLDDLHNFGESALPLPIPPLLLPINNNQFHILTVEIPIMLRSQINLSLLLLLPTPRLSRQWVCYYQVNKVNKLLHLCNIIVVRSHSIVTSQPQVMEITMHQ